MRHLLATIDLANAQEDEKDMSEQDRKSYCGAIYSVFSYIEKDIKRLLYKQLMFASNNAENWEQVVFARGTFNGIDILLEKWRMAAKEHEDSLKETKPEQPNSPISEL